MRACADSCFRSSPPLAAAAATAGLSIADDDGAPPQAAAPYEIGLWGDLPYSAEQRATGMPNLIDDMNAEKLAFSVHDGDIKAGGERCDNPIYTQFEGFLNELDAPAMYTPGDNEWTDCDRANNGPYNSAERLAYIRSSCSTRARSFGRRTIPLEVQAAPYVENRRWRAGRVTLRDAARRGLRQQPLRRRRARPGRVGGARRRDQPLAARDVRAPRRDRSAAVMLITQANPGFDQADPTRSPARDPRTFAPEDGFTNFLRALREETIAFRGPVVLVHGDSHYFRIDKPLQDAQGRRLENFTRLETQGDNAQNGNNDVHWTKVTVDPRSDEVFSFQQQVVPATASSAVAGEAGDAALAADGPPGGAWRTGRGGGGGKRRDGSRILDRAAGSHPTVRLPMRRSRHVMKPRVKASAVLWPRACSPPHRHRQTPRERGHDGAEQLAIALPRPAAGRRDHALDLWSATASTRTLTVPELPTGWSASPTVSGSTRTAGGRSRS